jgi:hypothetical protein
MGEFCVVVLASILEFADIERGKLLKSSENVVNGTGHKPRNFRYPG